MIYYDEVGPVSPSVWDYLLQRTKETGMRQTKALAVAAVLLAGAVVRIELGKKQGQAVADECWMGHLDTIAELLNPSREERI